MDKNEIFATLKPVIAEQLGVEEDQVTLEASFVEDLNADSLDLVELIMSFEETMQSLGWEIEISDEDAEKTTTVGAAVDLLFDKQS